MALLIPKLISGLANMTPVDNEADAIANFAAAWEDYFYDAGVLGAMAVPGSLTVATQALKVGLAGLSVSSATALQTGLVAFWGSLSGLAATVWPGSLSTTPPVGLISLGPALVGVFSLNLSIKADLNTAASNLAATLHTTAGLGGFAVLPTPAPPSPIL